VKTSADSPIRVDFVPQTAHNLPGRLGLTIAPGKCDGWWTRDLAEDLRRLREHYHADVLVSLLEPDEYEWLGIANLADAARDAGIDVLFLPIRDVDVPASMSDCQATVRKAVAALRAGQGVVVHCRGGLGRSGLVAACCLVECCVAPDAAIEEVREARPGAIETREQEEFVTRYANERAE
jgi:protein-tyrosine phosphatase